jgi:hypothetical protein
MACPAARVARLRVSAVPGAAFHFGTVRRQTIPSIPLRMLVLEPSGGPATRRRVAGAAALECGEFLRFPAGFVALPWSVAYPLRHISA